MQRRFALAAALAFTIVVTFAVVTLGTRARLFGADTKREAAQALADAQPSAAPPTAASAPPAQPQVVTEYVYVDAPGGARQVAAPAAQQAAAQSPAPAAPAGVPTQAPPTPAPPTVRPGPTQAPPPTTAPAPTTTPPPAPTSAPRQQSEIEFVGTVTAVQGNMVTFSYSGTSVVVQVNSGSLQVGDQAHVHANLVNGVYVASEIEMGN